MFLLKNKIAEPGDLFKKSSKDNDLSFSEQDHNTENKIQGKKTLHEVTTKTFSRTPKGLLFAKDVKDIFCIVLICMENNGKLTKGKSKKRFFHNKESSESENEDYYTFSLETCIETMENLKLTIDMDSTTVTISYSIKSEMSAQLIKLFLSSKMLHIPNDRTRSKPKEKCLLQPTPKGVAILTKYVHDMGIKKVPQILYSNLNSIKLFNFERSSVTDRIVYNGYFIKLIFMRMFGDAPNIWSPNLKGDQLPPLKELLERTNDSLSFDDFTFSNPDSLKMIDCLANINHSDNENPSSTVLSNNILAENISNTLLNDLNRTSPLTHKFFTNPDSDSHIQYYTTSSGLRIWDSKEYVSKEGAKRTVKFSFSTKAIVQWLMDCTDLIYFKEAFIVATLCYKNGLIIPITMDPSVSSVNKFGFGKQNLYTFSKLGCCWLKWSNDTKSLVYPDWDKNKSLLTDSLFENDMGHMLQNNSISTTEYLEQKQDISLDSVLKDPGKRFLFKNHLEKALCSENFYAYLDIKKFLKKIMLIENLVQVSLKSKQMSSDKGAKATTIYSTINNALKKEVDECLSVTYQIFSTYIATGSPRLLNIDYKLRSSISSLILGSGSPVSGRLNELVQKQDLYNELFDNDSSTVETGLSEYLEFKDININKVKQEEVKPIQSLSLDSKVISNLKRNDKPEQLVNLSDSSSRVVNNCSDSLFSNQIFVAEMGNHESHTVIHQSLFILTKLKPLFEEVNKCLYKIMETDSLPKFLSNDRSQ